MRAILADPVNVEIVLRLVAALVIGALIGLERGFHGRPAGFRTHALVCLSTSLLMLVAVYEAHWLPESSRAHVALDPTRMAQGIMTGIGFLGAGTIMKEGLSVRGLTTAASIWTTAAIGILVGIGFYVPAAVATALTFGTLSVFRTLERRLPAQSYAELFVRFAREEVMPEPDLRRLLAGVDFTVARSDYRRDADAGVFEYRMLLRTGEPANIARLSAALDRLSSVREFRVSPVSD